MSELVAGKCPNCGANINLPSELETTFCAYCGSNIQVKEAIEKLQIELSGKVEVDGIASLNKLYKNAEDYMKLDEYENAYDVYTSIIRDNPGEVRAYYLALNAISYKMERKAENHFPSTYLNDINICLERLKKLDPEGKYSNFIMKYTEYIETTSKEEKFISKVNSYNDSLRNVYKDAYAFEFVESDYNEIKEYYEDLNDDLKNTYASVFEECTQSYHTFPRKGKLSSATDSVFDAVGDIMDNPFSIFGKFRKK